MWQLRKWLLLAALIGTVALGAAKPVRSLEEDDSTEAGEAGEAAQPGKPRGKYDWEQWYGYWRHSEQLSLAEWTSRIPAPVPRLLNVSALNALPDGEKAELFHACLTNQAKTLSSRVLRYRSPKLADVTAAVRLSVRERLLRKGFHLPPPPIFINLGAQRSPYTVFACCAIEEGGSGGT